MNTEAKPSVLFVYYTYTQQTLKVVETMARVLRDRGSKVALAEIEFTDPRYAARFREFPMPHPYREVIGMIPPELLGKTGEIRIPTLRPSASMISYALPLPLGGSPRTCRSAHFWSQK
jgi:hypothetical protein